MRINSITLKNFSCFAEREIGLALKFNLLVGDNGSGKTSVLDALAVGLGSLFLGFPYPAKQRGIHRDEVRRLYIRQGDTITAEPQFPCGVECSGVVENQPGPWSRELNSFEGKTTRHTANWIQRIATDMRDRVKSGASVVLPVISYYGTGRLWLQMKQRGVETLSPNTRFMGYLDCLNPASDQKRLLEWFKTNEIAAIQRKSPIGVLEAVRRAVMDCVGDAEQVYFDVAQDQLMLRFPDRELPFDFLSDGYRNLLAMAADIAVRCATLNPALNGDAARMTPGVVLIDEIDLHLHPKWQRRVVGDLMRAFPLIQFVGTTHSPFIIQSPPADSQVRLINLSDTTASDYINRSVEDISEDVQGIDLPQRSRHYLKMMRTAERYFHLLAKASGASSDERDRLKEELDRLSERYGDDPAYQGFLRAQRLAAKLDGDGNHATD